MLRTIVVDDDLIAIKSLQYLIDSLDNVQNAGYAQTLKDSLPLINLKNPDIVFLDLELGNNNGFELLDKYHKNRFNVICVSGHPEYALEGIKHGITDFLVKPVQLDELKTAVNRCLSTKADAPKSYHETVPIHTFKEIELIPLNSIIRIEADSNYSNLVINDGRIIASTKPLGHYEKSLNTGMFLRVNRQDLVLISCIKKVIKGRYPILKLSNGDEIKVSDRKRKVVLELYKSKSS